MIAVVQSLSRVRLFATLWTAARQASLPFTISRSLLKLMSIESVMSSNHLILCCPLLLPPSIFPSIRVFSNKSALSSGGQEEEKNSKCGRLCKNLDFDPLLTSFPECCSLFPAGSVGLAFTCIRSRGEAGRDEKDHPVPSLHGK